jgi:hypothetical protein
VDLIIQDTTCGQEPTQRVQQTPDVQGPGSRSVTWTAASITLLLVATIYWDERGGVEWVPCDHTSHGQALTVACPAQKGRAESTPGGGSSALRTKPWAAYISFIPFLGMDSWLCPLPTAEPHLPNVSGLCRLSPRGEAAPVVGDVLGTVTHGQQMSD